MALTPFHPHCTVTLYHNVPLDHSYTDVVEFDDHGDQDVQLGSYLDQVFTNVEPIRADDVTSGAPIRLPVRADTIWHCNYLSYTTDSPTIPKIYCFIQSIEWINVNMCRVNYEIDVWMSYRPNAKIGESFIARMHTPTDVIGENTVDEQIPVGEYVITERKRTGLFIHPIIVLARAVPNGVGAIQNHVYSGVEYITAYANGAGANTIDHEIQMMAMQNRADEIVSIFMSYEELFKNDSALFETNKYDFSPNFVYQETHIDLYEPKNKKMFTYPYNYCLVDAGNDSHAYRFEQFAHRDVEFLIVGDMSPLCHFTCSPKNYKIDMDVNILESVSMNSLPQCTYNIDTYKAWFAQNSNTLAAQRNALERNTITNMAVSMGSAITNTVMTSGMSTLNDMLSATKTIVSSVNDIEAFNAMMADHQNLPNQVRGSQTPNSLFSSQELDFNMYHIQSSREYAERIDHFFSRFGYKINDVLTPSFKQRERFTYIRAIQPTVHSFGIPYEAVTAFKEILIKGVTVWRDIMETQKGDYLTDNAPLG